MDILERFHLALSYLEKSQRELGSWMNVREAKLVDMSQFDLVKDKYQRHVKQATELTDTIRSSQKASIPALEVEVKALRRAQSKLIDAISSGAIKPKQANTQNRKLSDELDHFEMLLHNAKTIVSAASTADLGSRIDLEFAAFTKQLDLDNPEEFEKPQSPLQNISKKNVLLIVAVGALLWWGWLYYDTLGHTRWRTSVTDNKQNVRIVCENTGNKPVRVVVPWNNGVPQDGSVAKLHSRTFGILVYIREKGKNEFQILPDTPDLWKEAGDDHNAGNTITLARGDDAVIVFDTLALRKTGLNVDSLRLVYTRYGGRRVDSFEVDVP
jgi:hypothetical protein